jgi:hypothetical protein
MGTWPVILAALLGAAPLAPPGSAYAAISLGEPQAVRSSAPPYIFRLPLTFQPRHHGETAAVTVRSPADALSFIKRNILELRLQRLTDVEIEISHAGQTLNRLLLKTELHRARARLEATTAWKTYQAAKARDQSTTRLAALLETALETHHVWARLDPVAARRPLALIAQERTTILPTQSQHTEAFPVQKTPMHEETPPPTTAIPAVNATVLEQELRVIRAEIQTLVGHVLPWDHEVPEVPLVGPLSVTSALALLLGGLVMAGTASLVTGYLMQHRALERERQRRRLFAAAIRRARQALPPSSLALSRVDSSPLPGPLGPARKSRVRHVHVSHSTRRRFQRWKHVDRGGMAHESSLEEQTRFVAQIAQVRGTASAELLTALGNLRHELISLRLMFPVAANPEGTEANSADASRC